MDSLTLELDRILLHLPVNEIVKFCRLNKKYKDYCDSRQHYRLWRAILVGDFYPGTDIDTIKRRWRQEEINSLNLFVEAYRKEYEDKFIRKPVFPQIGCIVAMSLKGKLDQRYFLEYPAVNRWKEAKNNKQSFHFTFDESPIIEIDSDENFGGGTVLSHTETLIIRILLVFSDTIVYDESIEMTWNPDILLEHTDEDETFTLTAGHAIVEGFCQSHVSQEFVTVGNIRVVNFLLDDKKIQLTGLSQNNEERIRLYNEFTETIQLHPTEKRMIAHISPDHVPVYSNDEQNLSCSIGDCGHKLPFEYLKWWIEEDRSVDCTNTCPLCYSSLSQ